MITEGELRADRRVLPLNPCLITLWDERPSEGAVGHGEELPMVSGMEARRESVAAGDA